MSETTLISHCAPTLAGLKSGNLFTCYCPSLKEAVTVVRNWNAVTGPKGVRVRILRYSGSRVLIYVYRPAKLDADLSAPEAHKLLKRYGYKGGSTDSYINTLAKKINRSGEFPHEIGLFLGYPPQDVKSFIENNGMNSAYTGYWKVYNDIDKARETFRKFSKCTHVYSRCMREGSTLDRLTVRDIASRVS